MNDIQSLFGKILASEKRIRIKLLGDSITHGEGGSGFAQNGEAITDGFRRNPRGYCWANLFGEALRARYDCEVINNACTGTNIQFIIERFDELVQPEDSIVFCAIGTNNRHQYMNEPYRKTRSEMLDLFYDGVCRLDQLFSGRNIPVVFIANIPASEANEQDGPDYWRTLHMSDIRDVYQKAQAACGFPLIDLYTAFSLGCARMKVLPDALLADGLHPNDRGHELICQIMLSELGLDREPAQ